MKIIIFILGLLLKVNTIDCTISGKNCEPELYKELEVLKGKSLFFVDLDIDKLESYQKKFPGTLILNFNEAKLSYTLKINEETFLVSEFGNILQEKSESDGDLPTQVIWNKDLEDIVKNNVIDKDIHSKIIKIINSTSKNTFKIKTITWNNDKEIILEIDNSPRIIIDTEAINSKINTLEMILDSREVKEYEQPIQEIDLRFNLPVLRTTQ